VWILWEFIGSYCCVEDMLNVKEADANLALMAVMQNDVNKCRTLLNCS